MSNTDNPRVSAGQHLLRDGGEGDSESRAGARCTDGSEHFRALAQAFDATDDKDWDHLFLMIPASGHGQFWKRVFNVVRKNLARIRQQESHCLQQHDHRAPAVGDKAGNHPLTASKASGPQPPPQTSGEEGGT